MERSRRIGLAAVIRENLAAGVFMDQRSDDCRFANTRFTRDEQCWLRTTHQPSVDFREQPFTTGFWEQWNEESG
jgi:hypothetical protein